jgi:levansucrase
VGTAAAPLIIKRESKLGNNRIPERDGRKVRHMLLPPARWTRDHIRMISGATIARTPRIFSNIAPVEPSIAIWDAWPVQDETGHPVDVGGGRQLWMALAAPRFEDPDDRHAHARIHLLLLESDGWRHLGPAMPDGFSPGSREWSGSAVAGPDGRTVFCYFTATGRRGERTISFEQRIFSATATLGTSGGVPRLEAWRALEEILVRDPAHYMSTTEGHGEVGKIKAFRDPAYFRDPSDGQEYLFFAGSRARSVSNYNGVVGVARREAAASPGWRLLPPILCADGLNNELERPHVVAHQGLYYLFWSTQRHVFDPAGPSGPTGLYAMVSDSIFGEWRPVNGSGLVFANPADAPAQAYSWFVLPDLSVTSFVDDWLTEEARSFGGTFAPFVHLKLAGATADVAR